MFDHRLITQRLMLEPVREEHAALVFHEMNDARLWRFFPHLRPMSVADLRILYRKWQAGKSPSTPDEIWENWICMRTEDQTPVGSTQATIFADQTALIAYAVYVRFERQGYAREAVRSVLEHSQKAHRCHKIFAEMDRRNSASINVVRSLGFTPVSDGGNARDIAYELAL